MHRGAGFGRDDSCHHHEQVVATSSVSSIKAPLVEHPEGEVVVDHDHERTVSLPSV